jgi:hypothetical protein
VHALGGEEAVMGRMSREKGKRFERAIAAELRKRWPDAVVRRSSQAERAYQSDVFIEGGPPLLSRLWLELQDARNPTPLAKLEQAERDISAAGGFRLPVVVWHRIGERRTNVTMRLWVLDAIRAETIVRFHDEVITLDFEAFVAVLNRYADAQAKKEAA